MITGHFTLWVKSQIGINWLASKALPKLGTALPQLILVFASLIFDNKLAGLRCETAFHWMKKRKEKASYFFITRLDISIFVFTKLCGWQFNSKVLDGLGLDILNIFWGQRGLASNKNCVMHILIHI
jgi:hypothetical protein